MSKRINIDCEFNEGFDAWVVEVKDSAGTVLKVNDYMDEDFEESVQKLKEDYKKLGNTVEVNIR